MLLFPFQHTPIPSLALKIWCVLFNLCKLKPTHITNHVPIHPDIIHIKHPANYEAFLLLPANNVQQAPPSEPRTFGVHHLTVLTTCQILTSGTGFLSSSGDRENEEDVVSMDPDGILTLE